MLKKSLLTISLLMFVLSVPTQAQDAAWDEALLHNDVDPWEGFNRKVFTFKAVDRLFKLLNSVFKLGDSFLSRHSCSQMFVVYMVLNPHYLIL